LGIGIKIAKVLIGIHGLVSGLLWMTMMVETQAVGYYSAIVFFLLNMPGVWILIALAPSSTVENGVSYTIGSFVVTQIVLWAALYLVIWWRNAVRSEANS
jgi:hypothetical protein